VAAAGGSRKRAKALCILLVYIPHKLLGLCEV
jgi:hypothetical protein